MMVILKLVFLCLIITSTICDTYLTTGSSNDINTDRKCILTTLTNCNTTGIHTATMTTEMHAGNYSDVARQADNLHDVFSKLLNIQDLYIIPIICPIGIVGNGLVAHNLFAKRNSNSSFIYMVFILLADMFSLISDLFLPLSKLLQLNTQEDVTVIAVYIYFWNADIISFLFRRFSLNLFCVLSFERLTAIRNPLKLCRSLTVTHPYIFIILSLFVSVLATIVTPLFTKMISTYDIITNTTKYEHALTDFYKQNHEYFGIVMIVVRFLDGPFQIVFFTIINGMIVHALYKNKTSMALTSNKDRCMLISKLQTRLCKIFLILSFTNMLAFLPNAIVIIVAKIFPETGLSIKSYNMKMVMFGGNILRVINSLTDFIVFLVISKDIRKEIKRKLLFCKKREKGDISERSTAYTVQTN